MVRILCEGKTDKKFILGILSHLGIENKGGDFEIMGCKNNFFDIKKYEIILKHRLGINSKAKSLSLLKQTRGIKLFGYMY